MPNTLQNQKKPKQPKQPKQPKYLNKILIKMGLDQPQNKSLEKQKETFDIFCQKIITDLKKQKSSSDNQRPLQSANGVTLVEFLQVARYICGNDPAIIDDTCFNEVLRLSKSYVRNLQFPFIGTDLVPLNQILIFELRRPDDPLITNVPDAFKPILQILASECLSKEGDTKAQELAKVLRGNISDLEIEDLPAASPATIANEEEGLETSDTDDDTQEQFQVPLKRTLAVQSTSSNFEEKARAPFHLGKSYTVTEAINALKAFHEKNLTEESLPAGEKATETLLQYLNLASYVAQNIPNTEKNKDIITQLLFHSKNIAEGNQKSLTTLKEKIQELNEALKVTKNSRFFKEYKEGLFLEVFKVLTDAERIFEADKESQAQQITLSIQFAAISYDSNKILQKKILDGFISRKLLELSSSTNTSADDKDSLSNSQSKPTSQSSDMTLKEFLDLACRVYATDEAAKKFPLEFKLLQYCKAYADASPSSSSTKLCEVVEKGGVYSLQNTEFSKDFKPIFQLLASGCLPSGKNNTKSDRLAQTLNRHFQNLSLKKAPASPPPSVKEEAKEQAALEAAQQQATKEQVAKEQAAKEQAAQQQAAQQQIAQQQATEKNRRLRKSYLAIFAACLLLSYVALAVITSTTELLSEAVVAKALSYAVLGSGWGAALGTLAVAVFLTALGCMVLSLATHSKNHNNLDATLAKGASTNTPVTSPSLAPTPGAGVTPTVAPTSAKATPDNTNTSPKFGTQEPGAKSSTVKPPLLKHSVSPK